MALVDMSLLALAQHTVDALTPDRVRVEVLDGMLVMNPPPSLDHGRLVLKLFRLLDARVPPGYEVDATGLGVYERDDPAAEYQQPDLTVFCVDPTAGRITGADVELVVEVVSPANRRHRDYEQAILDRAARYGIPWVLVVDPDAPSIRWWCNGLARDDGPSWVGEVDLYEHP